MRWYGGGGRSPRAGARRDWRPATRAALPLHERPVLAHEEVEMGALFIGELEEDLLAFRVLEALAVLLEESVRAALTANADHQRLLVVDTAQEALRALGKEPVCRALEEQKCRPRFELGIALEEIAIPCLEPAEV